MPERITAEEAARRVAGLMGWKPIKHPPGSTHGMWFAGCPEIRHHTWLLTGDGMLEVLEWARTKWEGISIENCPDDIWWCKILGGTKGDGDAYMESEGEHKELPAAVLLALLKAEGQDVEIAEAGVVQ